MKFRSKNITKYVTKTSDNKPVATQTVAEPLERQALVKKA